MLAQSVPSLILAVLVSLPASAANDSSEPKPESVLDFTVQDIDGKDVNLKEKYAGKVLLIVNTASECGYTPQYADLETLYEKYRDKGLEVLAFPSNDFGGQEPGSNSEIKLFCTEKYDVKFPLFAKIPVKGDEKHPLYAFLTDPERNPETGGEIAWNFTKFLVDGNGKVVTRYESKVKPTGENVTKDIEIALDEAKKTKKK